MSVQTWVSIRVQKHRCRRVSNSSDTKDRVWHDCPLNPHSSVCRSALVPWGGASNTRSPAERGTFSQVHRLPAPRASDLLRDVRCYSKSLLKRSTVRGRSPFPTLLALSCWNHCDEPCHAEPRRPCLHTPGKAFENWHVLETDSQGVPSRWIGNLDRFPADIVRAAPEPNRAIGPCGRLPRVRRLRNTTRWVTALAANETGWSRVFSEIEPKQLFTPQNS
jgi:hypothetical protein